jgi:hypothetical protein
MRENGYNYPVSFNLILSRCPEARLEKKWPSLMQRYEKELVLKTEVENKERMMREEQDKRDIVNNIGGGILNSHKDLMSVGTAD